MYRECYCGHIQHSQRLLQDKEVVTKQVRWQEFSSNFKFEWLHQIRKHNVIGDALRQKEGIGCVATLSHMISDFNKTIRQAAKVDSSHEKMRQ